MPSKNAALPGAVESCQTRPRCFEAVQLILLTIAAARTKAIERHDGIGLLWCSETQSLRPERDYSLS